jgi:hypothetical protein
MAKGIVDKVAEKAILIFVGEAARKLSKAMVGRAETELKKISNVKKVKRVDKDTIEDEEIIE